MNNFFSVLSFKDLDYSIFLYVSETFYTLYYKRALKVGGITSYKKTYQ